MVTLLYFNSDILLHSLLAFSLPKDDPICDRHQVYTSGTSPSQIEIESEVKPEEKLFRTASFRCQ